ncbi:NUDIX hydrolase domain-like protein [Mycena vitilis]|nr:NUDIX hydrolase domain-like protein [Mycena vitilis]
MSPPGLAGDLEEYQAGGSGDWFPAAEIRYYTNVFLICDDKLLLGYKKRGLGLNKYNGFGGKVEPGESTLDAALRELQEEAGITAPLEHAGTLLFVVPGEKWAHIDIFRAEEYSGTITESDEMRPEWFDKTNIPFDNMWYVGPSFAVVSINTRRDSDRYWLPLLLSKQPFSARADFERQDENYLPRKWWIGVGSKTILHDSVQ